MGEMLDCDRKQGLRVSDKRVKPIGRTHRTEEDAKMNR